MEKIINVNPMITKEISEEARNFTIGCLLSSHEFLDKGAILDNIDISCVIREAIRVEEILVKAEYHIGEQNKKLSGSLALTSEGYCQFLSIENKNENFDPNNIYTAIVTDFFMTKDNEIIMRGSSETIEYPNKKTEKKTINPIEITREQIIKMGEEYTNKKIK